MPRLEPSPYSIAGTAAFETDGLDRVADVRGDPERAAALWDDPRTRCLVVRSGRALMDDAALALVPVGRAPAGTPILLGVGADGPLFAVHPHDELDDDRAHGIRSAVARLAPDHLGYLVHAVALTTWHETHPRCARCGAPTQVVNAGYARRCPQDGSEHHPRTDPAVIVLVVDGGPAGEDRCLLGRARSWPTGRFSTLAGFVEPGETVEDAVAREVLEEVGVGVSVLAYAGSQPWPFPASLMLAYYATVLEGQGTDEAIHVDGTEIVEARWFDRPTLAAAMESGDVLVPPRLSVARRLIEGWYGAGLSQRGTWR